MNDKEGLARALTPDRCKKAQDPCRVDNREEEADEPATRYNNETFQQAPAQNLLRRHAQGRQQSAFPVSLFYIKAEQHRRKGHGSHDQENAHAQEEPCYVDRRLGGRLRIFAKVAKKQTRHPGLEKGKEFLLQSGSRRLPGGNPQGGKLSPPVPE